MAVYCVGNRVWLPHTINWRQKHVNLMDFLLQRVPGMVDRSDEDNDVWDRFGAEVAPLVIDSVGFTRTTQSSGIVHFLTQLAQARRHTERVLLELDPISFSFHADNCFAFFDHANAAVEAAIQIRKAINAAAIPLSPEEHFGVSMGVGYGKLLNAGGEDGYFGDEMNIASKLGEDLGSHDDIFLSSGAYSTLTIGDQFEFDELLGQVSGAEFQYYRLQGEL